MEEDDDGEQRALSRPWQAGGEHVEVEAVLSAHQKAGFRTEHCHLKNNIPWSKHVNSEKKIFVKLCLIQGNLNNAKNRLL